MAGRSIAGKSIMENYPRAAVVMGSDSDFAVVENCLKILDYFGVKYEVEVCSAHRTPERAAELARTAEDRGMGVIIAAAGMAAHLPGVLAAYTPLPVVGLPVKSASAPMEGMDALMSMVQMPPGIPVATVAVNGAENAAILAVQILSAGFPQLRDKMKEYKKGLAEKVKKKNSDMQDKLKGLK